MPDIFDRYHIPLDGWIQTALDYLVQETPLDILCGSCADRCNSGHDRNSSVGRPAAAFPAASLSVLLAECRAADRYFLRRGDDLLGICRGVGRGHDHYSPGSNIGAFLRCYWYPARHLGSAERPGSGGSAAGSRRDADNAGFCLHGAGRDACRHRQCAWDYRHREFLLCRPSSG